MQRRGPAADPLPDEGQQEQTKRVSAVGLIVKVEVSEQVV